MAVSAARAEVEAVVACLLVEEEDETAAPPPPRPTAPLVPGEDRRGDDGSRKALLPKPTGSFRFGSTHEWGGGRQLAEGEGVAGRALPKRVIGAEA